MFIREDHNNSNTHAKIYLAALELMDQFGFEGINVKMIAQKADINRGTFYLHFLDKYDLLSQMERDILLGIKYFQKKLQHSIETISDFEENQKDFAYDKMMTAFEHFYQYIYDNALFFQIILKSKSYSSLDEICTEQFIQEIFSELKLNLSEKAFPYYVYHGVYAQVGLLKYWFLRNLKETPEEMANILYEILEKKSIPIYEKGSSSSQEFEEMGS